MINGKIGLPNRCLAGTGRGSSEEEAEGCARRVERNRVVARIKCATTQGRRSRYNPILRGGPPPSKRISPESEGRPARRAGERAGVGARPRWWGADGIWAPCCSPLSGARYKLRRELVESREPIPSHFGSAAHNAAGKIYREIKLRIMLIPIVPRPTARASSGMGNELLSPACSLCSSPGRERSLAGRELIFPTLDKRGLCV